MLSFLTNPMVRDSASGILRHVLGLAGAYLATKGYLSADQINMLIGMGLGGLPIVWSFVDKAVKNGN